MSATPGELLNRRDTPALDKDALQKAADRPARPDRG